MTVREFKVKYTFHTVETAEKTVLAVSAENAREIAEFSFRKTYTDKYILDHVEVLP